jgi:hypothetical protein
MARAIEMVNLEIQKINQMLLHNQTLTHPIKPAARMAMEIVLLAAK